MVQSSPNDEAILASLFATSEEAYFGANNPFKEELLARITPLKAAFQRAQGISIQDTEKAATRREAIEAVAPDLIGLERCIATNINVERCRIAIVVGSNHSGHPMCLDEQTVLNSSYMETLKELTETRAGIKFKSKKKKYIYLILGDRLFSNDFTDGETAALILHAVAQSMEYMVIDVAKATMYYTLKKSIHGAKHAIDLTKTVAKFIFGFFSGKIVKLPFFQKLTAISNRTKSTLLTYFFDVIFAIITFIITAKDATLSKRLLSGTLSEKEKNELTQRVKKIVKINSMEDEDIEEDVIVETLNNFFTTSEITKIIKKILTVVTGIFYPILHILIIIGGGWIFYFIPNAFGLIHGAQHKELNKLSKLLETFSDSMVAFYGFAPEYASAIVKTSTEQGTNVTKNNTLGYLDFLNKVPLINVAVSTKSIIDSFIAMSVSGKKVPQNKISALHAQLRYELANNSDLTDADKKDIVHEMTSLEKTYEEFVYSSKLSSLPFTLVNFICRKNLVSEKDDNDISILMTDYASVTKGQTS